MLSSLICPIDKAVGQEQQMESSKSAANKFNQCRIYATDLACSWNRDRRADIAGSLFLSDNDEECYIGGPGNICPNLALSLAFYSQHLSALNFHVYCNWEWRDTIDIWFA